MCKTIAGRECAKIRAAPIRSAQFLRMVWVSDAAIFYRRKLQGQALVATLDGLPVGLDLEVDRT